MKIAMLVHNPVVGDARVRKESRSLVAAGHVVHLYGYGNPTEAPEILEGAKLTVVRKTSVVNFYSKTIRRFQSISDVAKQPVRSIRFGVRKLIAIGFVVGIMLMFAAFPLASLWPWLLFLFGLTSTIAATSLFVLRTNRKTALLGAFQRRIALPATHHHIASLIASAVDSHKYDVIHAHDIIALMAAIKLKRENGNLLIVWDAHELYPELNYKTEIGRKFMRETIRSSASCVDYFITINDSFVDYYAKNFSKLPPAVVLMNATRQAANASRADSPLRRAVGLADDQLVLLFQGGLSPGRGVEYLLEAAERMPDHWSLVFMGEGPIAAQVDAKIAELMSARTPDRAAITRIPPAPYSELASWTAGADLGAIPYRNTSLNHLYCTPNKLWEYPNAGVPILASDLVEMRSMIEKHNIGIIIPRDFSADDIVSVLEGISKHDIEKLSIKCREFSKIENWEKYEENLNYLYRSIRV